MILQICTARRVPRGEKRRDEIATVAERVFLERGFADTTMQIIAARAGASKETLYRHFGSKEGLFSEVVRNRSARVTSGLEEELSSVGGPREILLDLGLRLLRFLLNADSLSLYRVVVAEAPRAPELGPIFYAQGAGRLLDQLSHYLGSATQRGELRCPEPERAAKLFVGAVVSTYLALGLIVDSSFCETELQAHVEAAASMFIARYGA
jgi:TetR/AcrR family transcriptional regulator, mexJK operon transcriptional repressor